MTASFDEPATRGRTQSASRIAPDPLVLARVSDALAFLGFGSVTLTVHAGKVVQIDITERQRFDS